MKKIAMVLAGFLFALQCVSALTVIPENENFALQPGSTVYTQIEFFNGSDHETVVSFYGAGDYPNVSVKPLVESFSLNAWEKTKATVEISVEADAPEGFYAPGLVIYNSDYWFEFVEQELTFKVEVLDEIKPKGGIEFSATEKSLCTNEEAVMRVWVKNTSGYLQKVRLSSPSEAFLPVVNPDYVELLPGEERRVEVRLSPNSVLNEGDYSILLEAETRKGLFRQKISFSLRDCFPLPPANPFRVVAPNACVNAEKDETTRIDFKLENLSAEDHEVRIAVVGGLLTELNRERLTLESFSERIVTIGVSPKLTDSFGIHELSVYAFSDEFTAHGKVCVNVERKHSLEAELRKNNFTVKQDSARLVEVLIQNNGDFEESVGLQVVSFDPEIGAKFSEKTVRLKAKEDKSVFLSVSPSLDAETGKHKLKLLVKGSRTIGLTVYFEVTASFYREAGETEIEFFSFPEKVFLKQGEKDEIFVVLFNPSGKGIGEFFVSLEGLPEGVESCEVMVEGLRKGESVEVFIPLEAGEDAEKGLSEGRLVAENASLYFAVPLELEIQPAEESGKDEEKGEGGAVAGLASLSGFIRDNFLGVIALFILLVVLVLIAFNPSNNSSAKRHSTTTGV